MTASPQSIPDQKTTNRAIGILVLTRLFINMTRRFPYPFLPAISQELGVGLTSVQSAINVQSGVGITSPFFGSFSDQYGRKRVILACLALMLVAAIIVAGLPIFWVFAVAIVAFGVSKMIFDPAMQAYIADNVPYRRRALAIGVTELSWAGSLIIIAPLAGWLIGGFGLASVFVALSLFSIFSLLLVWRYLPADDPREDTSSRPQFSPLVVFSIMRDSRVARGALLYSLLFVAANEIIFINYAAWLDNTFDLAVEALGTVTIVIAVAEILGELIVIRFGDTMGTRRLAMIGALWASIGYFLLPALSFSLVAALFGIFFIFIGVEIGVVSSIPLFTEILPQSRAAMMSSNVAAHSIGRVLGGMTGAFIYEISGEFWVAALVAMIAGLAAVGMMRLFVPEQG
jgi:DHA1 family putative efflux transporter-like MFS transporter